VPSEGGYPAIATQQSSTNARHFPMNDCGGCIAQFGKVLRPVGRNGLIDILPRMLNNPFRLLMLRRIAGFRKKSHGYPLQSLVERAGQTMPHSVRCAPVSGSFWTITVSGLYVDR
jgi:hypothetical protein